MPGLHAILSASSAKRWLACPPSARPEEKLKGIFGDASSPYAREGTQAHAVAELKLRREIGEINDFSYQEQRKLLGDIPREMDIATGDYVDVVISKLYEARRSCPDARLFIEQRLDFSDWVPKGFGTGDAVIVSDTVLDVNDLKYGKGVRVTAVENPQARLYGLGALAEFGSLYDFPVVRNTIIQPRVNEDPVTSEVLTREELLAWGESIKPTAQIAWRGDGEFKPGDHCKFCAAKAICAARAAEAMRIFTHGFETPGLISDDEIPGILAVADTAEAWIKDIRAYAKNQALRGYQWPGYKLVRGRKGNRAWSDEDRTIDQLSRAGIPESKYLNRKLKSPGDLEKELGKNAFKALLTKYVTQPEGQLSLVPDTDNRVEVSSADADFSDMTQDTSGKGD